MLGNFSFGDYFKSEAIAWAWEFVTSDLKLPIDRLWVSIYQDDDEAYDIWTKNIGLPGDRIVRMGKEDNFWEIGVGPCGPCSEIYYDRGEDKGCRRADCKVGCDCDRFVEFWNLVFTQFNKDEHGNYSKLPNPNIDTGMGLERISAIMQGVDSLFEVDTIKNIIGVISRISGVDYGIDGKSDISIRVIADHARGMVFMISDGILPSNEGRGYVLRRIIRRAAHHGRVLGIVRPFLAEIAQAVINESSGAYKELRQREEYILKVVKIEENRFKETIEQGAAILQELIDTMKENGVTILDGGDAFRLYDTYGFPFDLTKEILSEHNMLVDEQGFLDNMKNQRDRARSAHVKTDFLSSEDNSYKLMDKSILTAFTGYRLLETESRAESIIKGEESVDSAFEGDDILIVLDETPFYGESGGQSGDRGKLVAEGLEVIISDTKKVYGDRIIHTGKIEKGILSKGQKVVAKVDKEVRLSTARNHTATHLLHRALKTTLGEHAEQAGSMVDKERLRFDFRHFTALTEQEIAEIERMVNEKIMECLPVDPLEMSFDEARQLKAIALFGEKYGDTVRVIKIGDYSTELCGGTHLTNTGQAGLFRIVSESGIAAGIRRIEAVTGWNSYDYTLSRESKMSEVSAILKTSPSDLEKRAVNIVKQVKELEKEIEILKGSLLANVVDKLLDLRKELGDLSYIFARADGYDVEDLRSITDRLKDRIGGLVVVLAGVKDGKVHFIGSTSKDNVSKGVHVGKLIGDIAKIADGGGGGRADMARAGAKDSSKIYEALLHAEVILAKQIGLK
jgi:alanyl-tRNA synthetase